MESYSDPGLITVKINIPGEDGIEDITRKFKLSPPELQRNTIHNTVLSAIVGY